MKKIFLLSSFLLGGLLIAQKQFANIYSTEKLQSVQNSIPENDRQQFYVQYLKAQLFENIKDKFNSKKYSDELLRKFTDTIISHNNFGWDESVESEKQEKLMTFAEYENFEKDRLERSKKAVEEAKKMKGFDKETKDLMSSMLDKMDYEKTGDIKKDYEKYKEDYEYHKNPLNNLYSPESRKLVITKLNQQFANKNYKSEETEEVLHQNFSPNFSYFPTPVSKHDSEMEIYEVIENDILAYGVSSGVAAGTYENYYKIVGETVVPISIFPYEDKNFDATVSKYAKKGFHFEPHSGAEIKKINNEYYISTWLYKDEDFMTYASLLIEYKTKDFKTFTPLKIADNSENPKWKTIK